MKKLQLSPCWQHHRPPKLQKQAKRWNTSGSEGVPGGCRVKLQLLKHSHGLHVSAPEAAAGCCVVIVCVDSSLSSVKNHWFTPICQQHWPDSYWLSLWHIENNMPGLSIREQTRDGPDGIVLPKSGPLHEEFSRWAAICDRLTKSKQWCRVRNTMYPTCPTLQPHISLNSHGFQEQMTKVLMHYNRDDTAVLIKWPLCPNLLMRAMPAAPALCIQLTSLTSLNQSINQPLYIQCITTTSNCPKCFTRKGSSTLYFCCFIYIDMIL